MRTRDEMLKDANTARNGYAYLKNSEDALPVRLAMDVTELLAEIERLKSDLSQSRSAITKLSREIWKVC